MLDKKYEVKDDMLDDVNGGLQSISEIKRVEQPNIALKLESIEQADMILRTVVKQESNF